MKKIYILLSFLILFITPSIFIFHKNQTNENFANKNTPVPEEGIYTLQPSNNGFSFKIQSTEINIYPSNKTDKINDIYFFYTSAPDKTLTKDYKFQEIDNQNFRLSTLKDTFQLGLFATDKPLVLSVNDFDKTFQFEKAKTGNKTDSAREISIYNIIHFGNPCGNIKIVKNKNNITEMIIKTKNNDIKESPTYLSAIFTGFLIFQQFQNINSFDYDKFFSKK